MKKILIFLLIVMVFQTGTVMADILIIVNKDVPDTFFSVCGKNDLHFLTIDSAGRVPLCSTHPATFAGLAGEIPRLSRQMNCQKMLQTEH
ncbi:MAG: hypothetical protein AB7S75_18100 [Desulfococcaceae bacterium]